MPLIVLDPGHGEKGNPHTTKAGFYEGTQNFILAGKLRSKLEAAGFTVLTTRESVTDDPSLEERGRLAGENGADMFISIHSNAPGTNAPNYSEVCGSEVFYSVTDKEWNIPVARKLNAAVVEAMQTKDRGIKIRLYPERDDVDYYGVIRHSAQSGCKHAFLIEHGFHTNPHDSSVLQSDEGLERIAEAEARVICEVFGV